MNRSKDVVTKIAREACRRDGAGHARAGAAGERYYGECDQDKAVETDLVHAGTTLEFVDELCRDEGDDTFDDHLADDEHGRKQRVSLELPDALAKRRGDLAVAELFPRAVGLPSRTCAGVACRL